MANRLESRLVTRHTKTSSCGRSLEAGIWYHSPSKGNRVADDRVGHWNRGGLADLLGSILRESGRRLDELTVADLAPLDQFHHDGRAATLRLAGRVSLKPGTTVLDVGGGLGGPARTLAAEFGCLVTVLDLTEDYLSAGEMLTAAVGLQDRVRFEHGDALDLPYGPESFDVVWTQNSGMNIADKARLYDGFARVLRAGGKLATQEPVAGPAGPPAWFPVMWADDSESSFLLTRSALRDTIIGAGFVAIEEDQAALSTSPAAPFTTSSGRSYTIQALVMGERLPAIVAAGARNREAGRLDLFMGVFRRE